MWDLLLWCASFSSCGARALEHVGLVAPQHVVCGILASRPGIEPASPALEGRFLTTGPPGKSQDKDFLSHVKFGLYSKSD